MTLGAIAVLAALSGCSGTGGSGSAAVPAIPPDAAGSSVTANAAATAAQPSSAGADSATTASRCVLADLAAQLTPPEGRQNQRTVRVVWTNSSPKACTMTGFGGADLRRMPADRAELPEPQRGDSDSISLPRSSQPVNAVRLAPGARAHSTITYLPLPDTDLEAFEPDVVVVTPPDETHSVSLRWTGGGILRQDGATHPGTFLGPVQPGAS